MLIHKTLRKDSTRVGFGWWYIWDKLTFVFMPINSFPGNFKSVKQLEPQIKC